jgi:hypothetical protein
MSWSLSGSGKKAQAAERVSEQAAALTYLTGLEAELKDKAVELTLKAIDGADEKANISVSLYGTAVLKDDKQVGHSLSVSVSTNLP